MPIGKTNARHTPPAYDCGMEQLSIPPFTLRRLPTGELVAEHPAISKPVPVPDALLLRVVKAAVRQSLETVAGGK